MGGGHGRPGGAMLIGHSSPTILAKWKDCFGRKAKKQGNICHGVRDKYFLAFLTSQASSRRCGNASHGGTNFSGYSLPAVDFCDTSTDAGGYPCSSAGRIPGGTSPHGLTRHTRSSPAAASGSAERRSGAVPCVAEQRRGTVRSGECDTAPGCDGRSRPGGVRGRSAVGRRFCDAKRDVAT